MIGIVGGVGPLAGLDVFRKIIEETKAEKDQDHSPVLLHSIPGEIMDRTLFLIGEEKINPAHSMAKIILGLEMAGATVAGIPCNTAHAPEIFSVIEEELASQNSRIRLLHMIQEVIFIIQTEFPAKKIGILSTTGTKKSGIYRNALSHAGSEVIEVEEDWQERVHRSIYDPEKGIKAKSSPVTEWARKELIAAMDHLQEKGAEVIILGCTEIPLAISELKYGSLHLIDPNRVLAKALLRH